MNTLLLADNGRPKATIVIGKHPTPAVALAARELQYHIQKISGAVPAVVTDKTAAMEEARKLGPLILIGKSEAAREAVGAISFEPQEYMVELANSLEPAVDTIVLWGDDAGLRDFEYTTVHGRVASMSGFGNACHFTENNRPIMVTGIDMAPDCGSLEAWVRPRIDPGSKGAQILRIPFSPTVRHLLWLEYVNDNVRVRYELWDGKGLFPKLGSGNLPAQGWHNQWHHILVTYEKKVDASSLELKLFVDGEEKNKNVCTHWNLGIQCGDVYIGGYVEGTDPRSRADFRGEIDEVRISRGVRNPPSLNVPVTISPYTADPDTMLLLHFDEADGTVSFINDTSNQSVIYEHRFPIPGIWENHGSLDAVYDFLERSCGVRWYAPGEIGEVYDKKATLAVDVKVVRRKPAMMHRDIAIPDMTETKTYPERQSDWYMVGPPRKPETLIPNDDRNLWLLRMRMGGTCLISGHSLPQSCLQYLDRYPGWFAQGGGTPPKKLCYKYEPMNHPLDDQAEAVLDERIIVALCKDAYNYFHGKPAILSTRNVKNCYSLVPDEYEGWCNCTECTAQKGAIVDKGDYFSNDERSFSVHDFTRRIAREIMLHRPDWKGEKWLCQYAYADYAHYPRVRKKSLPEAYLDEILKLEPDGKVKIEEFEEKGDTWLKLKDAEANAFIFTWLALHARTLWWQNVQDNDKEILNDWRQHAEDMQLGVYLYYQDPVMTAEKQNFRSFPGFCASHVAGLFTKDQDPGDTKYTGFKGLAGVHVEMSGWWASFLVDQLELYLTFKLAYDPEQSGDALTEEFFKRYYGSAAEPMRALYRAIEKRYTDSYISVGTRALTEELTWGSKGLGSLDEMAGYLKLMADAVAATRRVSTDTPVFPGPGTSIAHPIGEPTVYAQRVDLFRRGVWDHMFEGYSTYWKKQPTPRLPLLKPALRLLDWTQSGDLAHVLKELSWSDILGPFSCGQEVAFGEPSLVVSSQIVPYLGRFVQKNGEVVIVADQDHAFLCEIAQEIGARISAPWPLPTLPVRIVEVPNIDLADDGSWRPLFDHLARLCEASLTTLCAVLIVGWTTGFPEEAKAESN